MERHKDDETENLALRIYCASLDMDAADYQDEMPDDVAGLMADISILDMYGGGFIRQALEMIAPEMGDPVPITIDDVRRKAWARMTTAANEQSDEFKKGDMKRAAYLNGQWQAFRDIVNYIDGTPDPF